MNKRILCLTEEQKSQIEDFICYKEEQEVSKNTLIQYRKTLEIFLVDDPPKIAGRYTCTLL